MESSNGRTTDSESVNLGSNPGSTARNYREDTIFQIDESLRVSNFFNLMKIINSRLLGKADSYLLNAYIDVKIEEAILLYIKQGSFISFDKEVEDRVKAIIKKTNPENKNNRLYVKAFTYKWVNGYANYWYTQLLYKITGKKPPREVWSYLKSEFREKSIFHFTEILWFYHKLINKYALQNGVKINLKKGELKKEILEVQKINIRENTKNADRLMKGDFNTWKTKKLLEWSKDVSYPKIFLKSAGATQKAASRWDKLYSLVL